jgi:sulfur carrier protein ThiS
MNVNIKIKLFATLRAPSPETADCYSIPAGTTVHALLEQLKIPVEEVNLVFINGNYGNLTSILEGGDRLSVFPSLGGG